MRIIPLITLLALIFCSGCSVIKDEVEPRPAYIHIPVNRLTADSSNQGSSISKFTDVWVFAENNFIGAFELPANVPILRNGTTNLRIQGGVKVNGTSTVRVPYPVLSAYSTNIDLISGKVDTVSPVYQYSTIAKFNWIEDFEKVASSLSTSASNTAFVTITTNKDSVLQGNKSLMVITTPAKEFFSYISINSYTLQIGKNAYLELDYRNTVPLEIGIFQVSNSGNTATQKPLLGLNPTNGQWNKVYINVGTEIGSNGGSGVIKIYFLATTPEQGYIQLDNIKLISID
ncbi:MAG: hypothetical protein SGJ04_02040 [Bacteroidota bacterium]|nr:hypothetical protein [Bacteroidota bacterium]